MPSLVVIEPQIKEKQRGGGHNVPKDPSLNRVNVMIHKPHLTFHRNTA